MHRFYLILIAAALLTSISGCQKEIKEIRSPNPDRPTLLVSAD